MKEMKEGDRVKILKMNNPHLQYMVGVIGTITKISEPYAGDAAKRLRFEITFDEPVGPRGYTDIFPVYINDLEKIESA